MYERITRDLIRESKVNNYLTTLIFYIMNNNDCASDVIIITNKQNSKMSPHKIVEFVNYSKKNNLEIIYLDLGGNSFDNNFLNLKNAIFDKIIKFSYMTADNQNVYLNTTLPSGKFVQTQRSWVDIIHTLRNENLAIHPISPDRNDFKYQLFNRLEYIFNNNGLHINSYLK